MYVLALVMLVATLSLVGSFINRDYEVAYVAAHSNDAMADIHTWVTFYAGNEGSLLYTASALSVMAAIAIRWAPQRVADTPSTLSCPRDIGVPILLLCPNLMVWQ